MQHSSTATIYTAIHLMAPLNVTVTFTADWTSATSISVSFQPFKCLMVHLAVLPARFAGKLQLASIVSMIPSSFSVADWMQGDWVEGNPQFLLILNLCSTRNHLATLKCKKSFQQPCPELYSDFQLRNLQRCPDFLPKESGLATSSSRTSPSATNLSLLAKKSRRPSPRSSWARASAF